MKPRRHDALIASSLFLTQFIGHALLRIPLPGADFTTDNYRRLSEIARTTGRDTFELLDDMHSFNRRARSVPGALIREFTKLRGRLTHKK
jgi:hypothetical protein